LTNQHFIILHVREVVSDLIVFPYVSYMVWSRQRVLS
jgi:hypothetical protein